MKKTVLITGASGGIGEELAYQFAQEGAHVILVARQMDKLENVARKIEANYSGKVTIIQSDLLAPNAAKELKEKTDSLGLEVDTLINNAGFGLFGEFVDSELSKELDMIHLNITVLTELSKYYLKDMKDKNYGEILNIASTAAFQPGPLMAVYYASKAYVLSFSEALANESKDFGVKVSVLCPGPTETNFKAAAELESSKLFKSGTMSAKSVAEIAKVGMKREKTVIIPGFKNQLMAQANRFLPRNVVTSVVRKVQERG
ncbi:SDR family NAD(P)-dependent oxidoreductase [Mangrovibacillus cuniculi]|uniref:SDR family oxidoreductase n=1 Tax=Mangrovibacillus cuniculi TaxID=2593652 RepID=A0A7S8CCD9_9BACI|nr:SDR family oxidoreductase [Mangrovibacillus cuniculi]QPC47410.1 SDR family oxidoreductase [Mangrovibacillus cuniculi]